MRHPFNALSGHSAKAWSDSDRGGWSASGHEQREATAANGPFMSAMPRNYHNLSVLGPVPESRVWGLRRNIIAAEKIP